MIELINVEKTYKNGKSGFLALKNINLKLQDLGLVVILGKSGSGKSTLLNILGGIDVHTNGNIIVDNKNINEFKDKDLDNYRNNYIGFIFQEFNLINEITVNENVELPLKLTNTKDKNTKIDDILTKVGLNNIGHKKCNELSGGQRQRVAIARALIKDPKILLADEPTGALDSSTSIEIFELLKKIAKEKLVIVVTHNEELAYNYADRIIEIKDGNIYKDISRIESEDIRKIASNVLEVDAEHKITKKDLKEIAENGDYIGVSTNLHDITLAYDEIIDYKKENKNDFIETVIENLNTKKEYDNKENKISFKDAYKLAKDNLNNNKKKYRFLKSIFTCFSIILIVSFAISMLNINSFVAKQTVSKDSLNIINVSHLVTKIKNDEISGIIKKLDNNNYSLVNNYELTINYGSDIKDIKFVSESFNGIIESDGINKINFELLKGNANLENHYQIIVSDYMAYNFSKYGVLCFNNDNLEIMYPTSSELINKKIRVEETNKDYEVIGIYKTNFLNLLSRFNRGEDVSSILNSNIDFLYSKLYAKTGFYKQYKEDYKDYSFYEEGEVFRIDLKNEKDNKRFYFNDTRLELNKNKIDSNVNYYNLNGEVSELPSMLKENEIIISIEHLEEMFNEEGRTVSELVHTTDVFSFLNSSSLKLNLLQNNSYSSTDKEDISIVNNINVKIIGILDKGNRLFVSNSIYNVLDNYLQGYDSVYFFYNDSSVVLENKIDKLKEYDDSFVVGNNLVSSKESVDIEKIVNRLSNVFTTFAIVFLFLSFIVCLNYMNIIVKNRNKELTLYRTLGAKKKDIYKIFVFESINVSVKSIIGGIIGSYLIILILNNVLSSITLLNVSNLNMLSFNVLYCLLALISIFLICLFASYLCVRSLLNKKLIDAFKIN